MAEILPGYVKLAGSSQRYLTPSGENISRRQYENIRYRRFGWKSWSDYQRERKRKPIEKRDSDYDRWARAYAKEHDTKVKDVKSVDSDFNALYLAAREDEFDHKVEGPFDILLKATGLRQPDAQYDVGDTP